MTRAQAIPFVAYLLDDALSEHPLSDILPNAVLLGWRCGFEPLFVAVQSYLPDTEVDRDEATEVAVCFLIERGWFVGNPSSPDYVIGGAR